MHIYHKDVIRIISIYIYIFDFEILIPQYHPRHVQFIGVGCVFNKQRNMTIDDRMVSYVKSNHEKSTYFLCYPPLFSLMHAYI